jgi:hypothetical protein
VIAGGIVTGITVTTPGSGYTTAPTITIAAPPKAAAGKPANTTATATATFTYSVAGLNLTYAGLGYTSTNPKTVDVTIAPPPAAPAGATYTATPATATATLNNLNLELQPKAIQELFDPDFGRMNAILGMEIKNTTGMNQTTIPYYFIDPPTEIVQESLSGSAIGSADDGTQIWKITHNGVDTHSIHFHLFNVQLINRVGWDGQVKPPDANELGWKDTIRMNPLEDCIVALRPYKQKLPWDLPNSIRPLDVTMPIGHNMGFTGVDPANQPAPVTNDLTNFGWEFTWHCHILGHEENDMMRGLIFLVKPKAPTGVTAVAVDTSGIGVTVTWNKVIDATSYTVQSSTSKATTAPSATDASWTTIGTVTAPLGTAVPTTYTDKNGTVTTTDPTTAVTTLGTWYQVIANNTVGYTKTYTTPGVIGYPSQTISSVPSAPVGA